MGNHEGKSHVTREVSSSWKMMGFGVLFRLFKSRGQGHLSDTSSLHVYVLWALLAETVCKTRSKEMVEWVAGWGWEGVKETEKGGGEGGDPESSRDHTEQI